MKKLLQVLVAMVVPLGLVAFGLAGMAAAAEPGWNLDYNQKVMTWLGSGDGSVDIVQDGTALNLIRDGWTAKFETTVPGRLVLVQGTVDSVVVNAPLQLLVGKHEVTSPGPSGGFRWTTTAVVGNTCPPSDGTCWAYQSDSTGKVLTMTWTGSGDGSVDIHQGDAASLMAVRFGAIAIFTTTIPGEIIISTGTVNGTPVTVSDSHIEVKAGRHEVRSPSDPAGPGGFRWTPAAGLGWRDP